MYCVLRNVLIASLLVWCGCSSAMVRKPDAVAQVLSADSAAALLQQLSESSDRLKSLRSLSRATFKTDQEQYSMRLATVFVAPDNLRFELLPLNSSVTFSLLTSKGDEALFLDMGEKMAISGSLEDLLQLSFLNSPLTQAQLLSLVTGQLQQDALVGDIKIYQSSDGFIFSSKQVWYVTNTEFKLHSLEVGNSSGNLFLRANFPEEGRVVVELTQASLRLELDLLKEKINQSIAAQLFTPRVPRGFKVRNL